MSRGHKFWQQIHDAQLYPSCTALQLPAWIGRSELVKSNQSLVLTGDSKKKVLLTGCPATSFFKWTLFCGQHMHTSGLYSDQEVWIKKPFSLFLSPPLSFARRMTSCEWTAALKQSWMWSHGWSGNSNQLRKLWHHLGCAVSTTIGDLPLVSCRNFNRLQRCFAHLYGWVPDA